MRPNKQQILLLNSNSHFYANLGQLVSLLVPKKHLCNKQQRIFFTSQIVFLSSSQQHQSTEWLKKDLSDIFMCNSRKHFSDSNTATTSTILRPLYRSTCISRHLQLRTGGYCWCKVLLPGCPC